MKKTDIVAEDMVVAAALQPDDEEVEQHSEGEAVNSSSDSSDTSESDSGTHIKH